MSENLRSEQEIKAKILELKKEMGYRYTPATKELIKTKIETLKWVVKERERI